MIQLACCDDRRRLAVADHATLNGIDFIEVLDREVMFTSPGDRQRILHLFFVKPAPALTLANIRITGGVRIKEIRPILIEPIVPGSDLVVIHVDEPGDFSIYTLALVDSNGDPFPGLDPLLASLDFSFKVECPTDLDCKAVKVCAPAVTVAPNLDYLAKDYESFRRLMLDRLALLLPGWSERNPSDVGVTLVELLAYVGDQLSYQQDAVAAEAYLGTARHRVSVRRHARLVDYRMHDGANARTWVQVLVNPGTVSQTLGATDRLTFLTRIDGLDGVLTPAAVRRLDDQRIGFEWFEELRAADEVAVRFDARLQAIPIYTWGNQRCTLPRGATRATLAGDLSALLLPGHVLVLEEVRGPRTGNPADADPTHRQAVRLTAVARRDDPLGGRFLTPPNDGPVAVTDVAWDDEDALAFPLCVSAVDAGGTLRGDISVARGNVVLADHGRTRTGEELAPVPEPNPRLAPIARSTGDRCRPAPIEIPPARYSPPLAAGPCTQAASYAATVLRVHLDPLRPGSGASVIPVPAPAVTATSWDMDRVLPAISLFEPSTLRAWAPRRDLIASDEFQREFVVEVGDDQKAVLRFGDDVSGARPAPGVTRLARYRVGNGTAGNVAAGALAHVAAMDATGTLVPPAGWIAGARNPIGAAGGREPETIEEVRQRAPFAFRIQERAVTPADYAEVTERHSGVQRAVATVRWTGSWRTVFLAVDRLGGRAVDPDFEAEIRRHLERYRLAGHDVEITGPRHVFLELELRICVRPDYFRSHVKAALLDVFASGDRADGGRGVFHPDNFTFGQDVDLGPLVAAAQAVEGVRFVDVVALHRYGEPDERALDEGSLAIGPFEIARLDADPNFPEHGAITFTMEGGW
jgi:hypothetical protein